MLKRIFLLIVKVLIALILILIIGLAIFLHIRDRKIYDQEYWDKEFAELGGKAPIIKQLAYEDAFLSYADNQNNNKPIFILIHGAPGTNLSFLAIMKDPRIRAAYHLIAIDRLGYGSSMYGVKRVHFSEQVKPIIRLVQELNAKFPHQKIYLMGHSYGGPIASAVGLEYPELAGILLVASAADPDNEKFWWFNPILEWPVISYIVPPSFRVANAEKMAHVEENRRLGMHLGANTIPTIVVQGTEDRIVPPINASFLEQVLPPAPLSRIDMMEGANHLILFNDMDMMWAKMQAIVEFGTQ